MARNKTPRGSSAVARGSASTGDQAGQAAYPDHLARLEVRAFKSLQQLAADVAQVNVFVGANGSGKSNLLEAIGVIGAAASGIIDDQALLRRGVRPGVLYKSSFEGVKKEPKISLRVFSKARVEYHAYITNRTKSQGPYWAFGNETLRDGSEEIASRGPGGQASVLGVRAPLENDRSVCTVVRTTTDTPHSVRQLLGNLDDFAIFAPVTPVLRGIAPDPAPRVPVGLYGGQLPEAIGLLLERAGSNGKRRRRSDHRFLEKALELVDWARGFDIVPPSQRILSPSVPTLRFLVQFTDRFMARGRNQLSGYDASEGALYLLYLLVLAMHPGSPRCLAIDNFDQALNPRTARAVTRLFVDEALTNGRQVFLTTHNPLVLDGLPLWDRRVRLFTVDRNRQGMTEVHPVQVRDAAALKKKHGEFAISRLWITGRLGGVPDV